MLAHQTAKLQQFRIILASQSPRRRQILTTLGLKFDVVPSRFEENLSHDAFPGPAAYVVENARQKAEEVFSRVAVLDRHPCIVIGSDTIVVKRGCGWV